MRFYQKSRWFSHLLLLFVFFAIFCKKGVDKSEVPGYNGLAVSEMLL